MRADALVRQQPLQGQTFKVLAEQNRSFTGEKDIAERFIDPGSMSKLGTNVTLEKRIRVHLANFSRLRVQAINFVRKFFKNSFLRADDEVPCCDGIKFVNDMPFPILEAKNRLFILIPFPSFMIA
ncbi:MAG: hypothetical protein AAF570_14105 [Bacteroidota bacterium]